MGDSYLPKCYKSMKIISNDDAIVLQGKKLKSLFIRYNKTNRMCVVEVSKRAGRVCNYLDTKFYGEVGGYHYKVLYSIEPADFIEIAEDIDAFITMLYS